MNNPQNNQDSGIMIILFVVFLIFLIIPAIYAANKELANNIILSMSSFNLSIFANFSDQAYEELQKIKAMDAVSLTFDDVYTILKYTGTWTRYPAMLLLVIMGLVSMFLSRKGGLRRKFSMESLLQHNAQSFPCVTPVVGKGKYLLSQESFDTGLWKVARTPVQFCVENELLEYPDESIIPWEDAFKNGLASAELPAFGYSALNKNKCFAVLYTQVAAGRRDFDELPPVRKVLASVFLAFGNDKRKEAVALLDTCSRTYFEKDDKADCQCFYDSDFMNSVEELYKKYENTPSRLISNHKTFELPWFMGLLYFARKKGLLAPSQFLFVRPVDRELFYTLHQCGGRAAWAEAIAPWTHYQAEEKAQKTLETFDAHSAYDFLHTSLNNQGWLYYGD